MRRHPDDCRRIVCGRADVGRLLDRDHAEIKPAGCAKADVQWLFARFDAAYLSEYQGLFAFLDDLASCPALMQHGAIALDKPNRVHYVFC